MKVTESFTTSIKASMDDIKAYMEAFVYFHEESQ